ncbi:MAG TPA: flavodoxin domain-containing protein [Amycolatopsis sp.]|nr:flavodoxin domain-containing protein [Amycolatopsis sp.]
MRTVIVYESMFGNTERIARAIADGLAVSGGAEVVNVDDAPADLTGIDLLIVGGPTHMHGMSNPTSRKSAAQQTDDVKSRNGLREWLDSLDSLPKEMTVASFDTRLDKPRWLTGSAAAGATKRLKRHGCKTILSSESFFVAGSASDLGLAAGELERAHAWGEALAAAARRAHA